MIEQKWTAYLRAHNVKEESKCIMEGNFSKQSCYFRSRVIKESHSDLYTLIFGSLRFEKNDGPNYWKYAYNVRYRQSAGVEFLMLDDFDVFISIIFVKTINFES